MYGLAIKICVSVCPSGWCLYKAANNC